MVSFSNSYPFKAGGRMLGSDRSTLRLQHPSASRPQGNDRRAQRHQRSRLLWRTQEHLVSWNRAREVSGELPRLD